jgi:hypothetical protein
VSGAFPPKVVAADEGKTVMLFGVRFGYKVVSGDSGGRLAVLEVDPRARADLRGQALSFDRVAGQAVLEQREGLGSELADIGREPAEAFA